MLKKLLKYDLKKIFKFLVVFYLLSIFFGFLTRIFLNIENSFMMNVIGQICSGVTISMIINILINNLMRSWVNFKQNIYGDESYLTHTLPVSKKTIYLSKFITAISSLFISILVIGLSLFIAYYSKENIAYLKNLLLPIATAYDSTILKILLSFLFVFFLEIATALQAGFTGIIIGHKMNNHKISLSVLFGFITYMLSQVLALLLIFIGALFNKDLMNLFFTNEIINIDIIKVIIYMAMIIYIINLIIGYIVNLTVFKKGVNVD